MIRQFTVRSIAAMLVAAILTTACQEYQAKPLDLDAHRGEFLERTTEGPAVAEIAKSIAQDPSSMSASDATFDLSDGLSLREAEAVAMVFNAQLRIARLRAGVTKATADTAGLWEDPVVGVDIGRILGSSVQPWEAIGGFSLTIPISGRLAIEKERAGAAHVAEIARVAQDEWIVRMSLRRAWCEWSAIEAQLVANAEYLDRLEQILPIVDKLEKAGEMSRSQAQLFKIERASRSSDVNDLRARVAVVELKVRRLVGLSPLATISLQASGIGAGDLEALDPIESARGGALQSKLHLTSPLLIVLRAEYEVAERTLALEIRKQYPDLTVGPGYGTQDGLEQFALGLSAPIPILNANTQAIAQAIAERDVSRASAEAAVESLVADIAQAGESLRRARVRSESLTNEIVPLVDAQFADVRQIAQLGEVDTLVLLESLNRQQEAKQSLIDALREEALAEIQLREILGPTIPMKEKIS